MTPNTTANARAEEASEALSQAYYLIMGRAAEWSNSFGHEQALQDIDDAQRAFRAQIKKAQREAEEAKQNEASRVVKALNMAIKSEKRAEEALDIARELADLFGHTDSCPTWTYPDVKPNICNCGATAALQRLAKLEEGKTAPKKFSCKNCGVIIDNAEEILIQPDEVYECPECGEFVHSSNLKLEGGEGV